LTNDRSGFFLHEDGNEETNPGTSGCIGVQKEGNQIVKVQESLNEYQKEGNDEIELIVNYNYDPNKKKEDNDKKTENTPKD